MVAVQMRYKNMIQSVETYFIPAQLKLNAFSAINHVEFIPEIDDLRGRLVINSRRRSAATEYMNFKI
jgi:hypothetical protein